MSRRASVALVAVNVIAPLLVLSVSVEERQLGALIVAIPSVLTIVGVWRLWASDELSALRRELRRAELMAQLKALQ